jgi:hypothetical protein
MEARAIMEDAQDLGELEDIRTAHVGTERVVVLVGWLGFAIGSIFAIDSVLMMSDAPLTAAVLLAIAAGWMGSSAILATLRARGRAAFTTVLVLSVAGAAWALQVAAYRAVFVLFVLISAFAAVCALLIWSSRATTVLSETYQRVVLPGARHVRRTTPIVAVTVLLLSFAPLAILLVADGLGIR